MRQMAVSLLSFLYPGSPLFSPRAHYTQSNANVYTNTERQPLFRPQGDALRAYGDRNRPVQHIVGNNIHACS